MFQSGSEGRAAQQCAVLTRLLSPLLANIALSALDDHFDRQRRELMGTDQQRAQRKRQGLGNWKLVRYADDFVVMVSGQRGHAEALREEVAGVLAPIGLRLSEEKTRVVHIDEGFDFLGFHIRRRRKRGTQKQCVYTTPSKKAVQAAKDKVRWKTRRSTLHLSLAGLITSLNQTLRGWANLLPARRVRAGIPASRQPRLVADRRVDPREIPRQEPLGWKELRRRFCDQGWRLAHDGAVFTGASSVTVTRYRYRGSTIATPWTPTPAAGTAADQRLRHVESPVR